MENLMLFVSSIGESWSTFLVDRFFSTLILGANMSDRFSVALSLFQFFAATIFVALLAWYVTKRMAMSRAGARAEGNLSVVESVSVGGQAVVRIVRAADKYFVIGVTKERVTLIGEVDGESISEPPAVNVTSPFGKILSRYIKPQDNEPKDEENE